MADVAPPSPRDDVHFDLKKILCRPSAFGQGSLVAPKVRAGGAFDPATALETVHTAKVLVVGAGGLGCELLKNLALSGFKRIWVVDADEIDVTNLNRQFLFRKKDVGHGKAETAARFVATRVPGTDIKTYNCFIQAAEKEEDFSFQDFDIVINGLDNLTARTWVSNKLMQLVSYTDDGTPNPESVIPLVDGGTEGYDGQIHVIVPYYTEDFEGRSWMFPKRKTIAACTLASNPRKPEHCVLHVMKSWEAMARKRVAAGEWEAVNEHGDGRKYNTDNPEDMKWITARSIERAEQFNLAAGTPLGEGFDAAYFYVLGVVKSIIPAIGSTNAIVAALSVSEALKVVSRCSQMTDNYLFISGAMAYYQKQSVAFSDLTTLPIRMYFPVDAETTVAGLRQSIVDNHVLNAVHFKYSVTVFSPPRKKSTGGAAKDVVGDVDGDTPIHVAEWSTKGASDGSVVLRQTQAAHISTSGLKVVADLRAKLQACGVLEAADLENGYWVGRYRPSDAAREAGGFSELPFHGHWLYKSDEDELALEPGSKLFVFPKLKSVPLVALNNCVPIGDSVSEKRLGPDLGAEHEHEFLLSDIRRAKGARGAPPRDIVLILYFTDLEDEDSSDSD